MDRPTLPDGESLRQLAGRLDITLSTAQAEQLTLYCQLLWEWNGKINLTRHTDLATFVARDLLDSHHLASCIDHGCQLLDIGSGGGVPAIPLQILRPDLRVTLAESVVKKATVLSEIVGQLKLPAQIRAERGEVAAGRTRYDLLTARAVGPLWKILTWLRDAWDHFDQLLLIKGPNWIAERGEARHRGLLRSLELRRIVSYDMPERSGQSVILSVQPRATSHEVGQGVGNG